MSAIRNILKLLLILEDGETVFNAENLSEEIGVGTRQIRNYIKELKEFGYKIESAALKGGGYKSMGQFIRLPLHVTKEELIALDDLKKIAHHHQFQNEEKVLGTLYYKLIHTSKFKGLQNTCMDYTQQYRQIHEKEEPAYVKIIRTAINDHKKIRILYTSAEGVEKKRIIHPYKLQLYKDAYYLQTYCEQAREHRSFKVIRMKEVTLLEGKFIPDSKIEKKLEKQKYGLFVSQSQHVILQFTEPFVQFAKEILLGENQKVTCPSEKITQIEVDTYNQVEFVGFLLSFGSSVKVIEPEVLRIKIKKIATEIAQLYEDGK